MKFDVRLGAFSDSDQEDPSLSRQQEGKMIRLQDHVSKEKVWLRFPDLKRIDFTRKICSFISPGGEKANGRYWNSLLAVSSELRESAAALARQ